MMRSPIVALAALLVSSGCLAEGAHARGAFQFGACVHVGQNKNSQADTRKALAVAGLTFRDEVFWHRLEIKPGTLEYPASLKDLDELVTNTVSRGLRPLLILDYGNKFYDGGELVTSDAALAAYARYVRFVVKHFKGRVDQFEVWNEWNIGLGSPTRRPGTAQAYLPLLRAAYEAVKAENPSAVVIGGAVAGIDDRWIDAFGRAGGFRYLDAFSVHPYNYQQDHPTPEADIEQLDRLKARVDEFAPGRNVPIYVTEVGWPTHQGPHGSTEAVEAAYLQRFMLLAKSRPWMAGVWWYDLFDDGDDPHNKEDRFGLLSHGGAAKPAFQALLAIKPLLESAQALAVTTGKDGRITVTGQGNEGKKLTASWLPAEGSGPGAVPVISVAQ